MDGDAYLVRVHAQGPDRVTCVMRRVGNDRPAATGTHVQGAHAEGFPGMLRDSVAEARLRERPFALCVIFLGGLSDIGHLIDFSIRQRVLEAVIDRLRVVTRAGGDAPTVVDAMGDALLGAIVAEGGNRDAIRSHVESIAASLSEPVQLNDAKFLLSPHIGVAIFGKDASSPQRCASPNGRWPSAADPWPGSVARRAWAISTLRGSSPTAARHLTLDYLTQVSFRSRCACDTGAAAPSQARLNALSATAICPALKK